MPQKEVITYSSHPTDTSNAQTVPPTCQPQSGQIFTPNIPDYYFNHQNAAAFRNGFGANMTNVLATRVHLFTGQSSCSGTVVAIQYCYQRASSPTSVILMDFAVLTRDGLSFRVEWHHEIRFALGSEECANFEGDSLICCRTTVFERNSRSQLPILDNSMDYILLACTWAAALHSLSQLQIQQSIS